MVNTFFMSPKKNFCIRHVKATAKFDNENKGKLRLAVRVILKTTKEIKEELRLLLLIKNDRETLKVESIDEGYNKRLYEKDFQRAAGLGDRLAEPEDKGEYVQFTITESFKELKEPVGNFVICPKLINYESCQESITSGLSGDIKRNISKNDILIEVVPKISIKEPSTLLVFQFVFVLDKYVDEKTISKWTSSSKVWSVNFDFHERISHEDLFKDVDSYFTYPGFFELWVYIPREHHPITSSPPYRKAFPLEAFETRYKVTGKEFETDEGDIAFQITNDSGEPERFSIICKSPSVTGEQLTRVEKELKEIPKWRDFLQNMLLTVALFSLLIGAIVILAQQAISWTAHEAPAERQIWRDFPLLVEISIFVGFSIWGIYTSLKVISEKLKGFDFLAYTGAITLGILGLLTQFVPEPDLLKYSIIAISLIFIVFGFLALYIRIRRR